MGIFFLFFFSYITSRIISKKYFLHVLVYKKWADLNKDSVIREHPKYLL